jgi:hypothetical protein
VCGGQCAGCYSVGEPWRTGGCGIRCAGCAVCGELLINVADVATTYGFDP